MTTIAVQLEKNKQYIQENKSKIEALETSLKDVDSGYSMHFLEERAANDVIFFFQEIALNGRTMRFKIDLNNHHFEVLPKVIQVACDENEEKRQLVQPIFQDLLRFWKESALSSDYKFLQFQLAWFINLFNGDGGREPKKTLIKAFETFGFQLLPSESAKCYQESGLIRKACESFIYFTENIELPVIDQALILLHEKLANIKDECFKVIKKGRFTYNYSFLNYDGTLELKIKEAGVFVTEKDFNVYEPVEDFDVDQLLEKIEKKVRLKAMFQPNADSLRRVMGVGGWERSRGSKICDLYRELISHYSVREIENCLAKNQNNLSFFLQYTYMRFKDFIIVIEPHNYYLLQDLDELKRTFKREAEKEIDAIQL